VAACEFGFKKGGGDDTLRCKILDPMSNCCVHVKFCRMTGHWENSDQYKECPMRKKGKKEGKDQKNGRTV